jgi:hypothetical protein
MSRLAENLVGLLRLGALLGVCTLSGCTVRLADFTVATTRNTLITEGLPTGPRTQGEDCVPVVLIPLGQPNLKSALDNALDNAGAQYDAMRDVVISHSNHSFLFGKVCFEVEGTPVKSRFVLNQAR